MALAAVRSYRRIARIEKTQGIKGGLVVRSTTGLPFSLSSGATVYFVPPALRTLNEARVRNVVPDYPCSLLTLEEVTDLDAAAPLVGRFILVASDLLDESTGEYEACIGRDVHCRQLGPLGTITEVMLTPVNDVWVVEGDFGEILIPVIDDCAIEIPPDAEQPILLTLLDGLIDTSQKEGRS